MTYSGQWPAPAKPAQPGVYPLRPLRIGEILGHGIRIAGTNLILLVPLALVIGLAAAGIQIAILSAFGDLDTVASGRWVPLLRQPTQADTQQLFNLSRHVLLATAGGGILTLLVAPVLAAIAAAGVAQAATRRERNSAAVLARLRGRWGSILGTGLLAGACIALGLILLVVPGVVVAIVLLPAGPVAAVEGGRPAANLRRAARLTQGSRSRLFGITLLAALCGGGVVFVFTQVVGGLLRVGTGTGGYVTLQLAGAVIGAVTAAFTAAVTALLYVDLRMRREGLAEALARSVSR